MDYIIFDCASAVDRAEIVACQKDKFAKDQAVGELKAHQTNDLQLVLENDQPHWD